jgi:hypothetical protein
LVVLDDEDQKELSEERDNAFAAQEFVLFKELGLRVAFP